MSNRRPGSSARAAPPRRYGTSTGGSATALPTKENGLVSMFMIAIEEGKVAFQYDVNIVVIDELPNGKTRERSYAKGADDGQMAHFRKLCSLLMEVANTKTNNFGMHRNAAYIYDKRAILFTSEQINIQEEKILISRDETNEFVRQHCGGGARFIVNIVPCQTGHVLDVGQKEMPEKVEASKPLRVFLETVTSQYAFNRNTFANIGSGKFYLNDINQRIEAGRGIELRSGVKKGARIVENKGKPCAALVLDATTSAFFKAQNLLTTIKAINGGKCPETDNEWRRTLELLEDVRVEPIYARLRSFGIGRFTTKAASETPLNDGNGMTVADYFTRVKNIALEHADLRTVIPNTQLNTDRPATYPIELLDIMPDQRVSIRKMDGELSEKLLKANAVKPWERLKKIMERAGLLGIFDPKNKVMNAFGVKVLKESNEVVFAVRSPPRIQFRDGVVKHPNPATTRFDSNRAKYVTTHQISYWIVLFPEQHQNLITRFLKLFQETSSRMGMRILFQGNGSTQRPVMTPYKRTQSVGELFERHVPNAAEFVLFIASGEGDAHAELKYYEALRKILTQHVTIEAIKQVVDAKKLHTLENIIHKCNCKNYGLNHFPLVHESANEYCLESQKVLVIGLDVSHPGPETRQNRFMLRIMHSDADSLTPSVVGICANMATHPHSFVGDYFYQKSRKEAIDTSVLRQRIVWIMETLKKNRSNNARPKYVFVLRDGLSEGQYEMAIEQELKAIKRGFDDVDPDYDPKIMYIVCTKRHFKRMFKKLQNGSIDNPDPGSVLQDPFNSHYAKEVWMQAHKAIQGTAKAVQYAILEDNVGLGTSDPLIYFLLALCYDHQISSGATSLPEPVYQADELASRGAQNYKTMLRLEPDNIPKMDPPNQSMVDYDALNRMLCYEKNDLCSTRVTA
ncbi:piwi domain-containing protein [Ditylenchus destructor]|uniref:Piwi domain-containing protein n=1 Tax=Ditylenchus destructor TaxID=166010 RepID=A0AAD4RCT0_9BILA|nr:piwi domain-containing protein [Ditylenchus destructor]